MSNTKSRERGKSKFQCFTQAES